MRGEFRHRMRDNMSRLSRGIVDYGHPTVSIDPVKIELSLQSGALSEGSIRVRSIGGEEISGIAVSHNIRMHIPDPDFCGCDNEIRYCFDASGIEPGEVIKGDICLLMNAGEFVLPYAVSVLHGDIVFEDSPVRNLFHFANVAQQDFDEAVRIFGSEDFAGLLRNNDSQYLGLYRGYSKSSDQGAALESFLCDVRKKQPLKFAVSGNFMEDGVFTLTSFGDSDVDILIDASGWGCMDYRIASDASFLLPAKDAVTSADFENRRCELGVKILAGELHAGKNYGRLTFESGRNRFFADFCINNADTAEHVRNEKLRTIRTFRVELIKRYIAFCIKILSREVFEEKCCAIAARLMEEDGHDLLNRLFFAHSLVISGRGAEAKEQLEAMQEEADAAGGVICGYHAYIMSGTSSSSVFRNDCCRKVSRLYLEHPESGELLWMLLHLDTQLESDPAARLRMIRHHFEQHETGSLLYLMCYNTLAEAPELMEEFGDLELHVLNFAARTGLFDEPLMRRAMDLVRRSCTPEGLVGRMLTRLYDSSEDDDVLLTICTLYIKADRMDEDAFGWYSLALEHNLNITRLIDYYMYSLPRDYARPLPRMVLMYFMYGADVLGESRRFLYSNIIQYCSEGSDILRQYYGQIRQYAIKCAKENRIDPALAVIYKYILAQEEVPDELLDRLENFVFCHSVKLTEGDAKYVVVLEEALSEEKKVELEKGCAVIPIYSGTYELFWEREDGVRFVSDSAEDELLLYAAEYENYLDCIREPSLGLCIYFCEKRGAGSLADDYTYPYMLRLVEDEGVRGLYKRDWLVRLLRYYEENSDYADDLVDHIDMSALDASGRLELLELLLKRGNLDEAMILIRRYGLRGVAPRTLLRILTVMGDVRDGREDELVLWLCSECFRMGKYDDNILKYLCVYLDDTSKSLRSLWKAAKDFELDTRSLEERMLLQMMYTGAYVGERDDIFETYVAKVAVPEVEQAWLTMNARDYVVMGALLDERFFDRLKRMIRTDEKLNMYCALALILYYSSDLPALEPVEKIKQEVAEYIRDFISRGIVMSFFMPYREMVPELMACSGMMFVEHSSAPGSVVTLNYTILSGDDREEEHGALTMKPVIPGIFSACFVLFYGESVQYYISEDRDEKTMITESVLTDRCMDEHFDNSGRYGIINEMSYMKETGDREELLRLMGYCSRCDYFNKKLFSPL